MRIELRVPGRLLLGVALAAPILSGCAESTAPPYSATYELRAIASEPLPGWLPAVGAAPAERLHAMTVELAPDGVARIARHRFVETRSALQPIEERDVLTMDFWFTEAGAFAARFRCPPDADCNPTVYLEGRIEGDEMTVHRYFGRDVEMSFELEGLGFP